MAHPGLVYVGVAAAVVLIAGGMTSMYLASPTGIQPGTTLPNSAEAGSMDGLVLGGSVNASVYSLGQTVSLRIWELNPLGAVVNVSAASDWPAKGLTLGPCGSLSYPFGFKLLSGYYQASSPGLGSAQGLKLYPGGAYSCPALFCIGSYSFQPESANAALGGFCTPGPCFAEPMNTTAQFAGSYSWASDVFAPLAPGVYTVVLGDEWGASAALYFDVSSHGPGETTIIPAGTRLTVSSSYDCAAGHYETQFSAPGLSLLTGAFAAGPPGATLYVATSQQAAGLTHGHPFGWVYSSGLTNSTRFSVLLPGGSYVAWIEGADLNCGAALSTPLEVLTAVNVTQGFSLTPS